VHATVDIGLGGVGHVDVGLKLNLKKYVPKELSTHEGLGTRDAARLEQYVRTFQFRWNQKMNLADALAKRAAKHRG